MKLAWVSGCSAAASVKLGAEAWPTKTHKWIANEIMLGADGDSCEQWDVGHHCLWHFKLKLG